MFDQHTPLIVNPLGIIASITWLDMANLVTLIAERQINLMVEIGVLYGGTASMMISRIAYDPGFRYLGVEIDGPKIDLKVKVQADQSPNAEMIIGDCFDGSFTKKVKDWIAVTTGPVLVFCDGGNKPREINHFAPLIRKGDYILTHDYHPEHATDKNPQWSDIKPYIDSGEFEVSNPDHWPDSSLFLIKRIS